VEIDEEESGPHPSFPEASLLGIRMAPDGSRYYLFMLERPVVCKRYSTSGEWEVQHILVAPKFQGDDIAGIFDGTRDLVPVGIGNVLNRKVLESSSFEWNDVEYFAVGYIRAAHG